MLLFIARGAATLLLVLIASLAPAGVATAATAACDTSLQAAFPPAAQTRVLLTRAFAAGEPLTLGTPGPATPAAEADVCMVKLLVGPGAPGPAGAPSTSAGIGIEVWLPGRPAWNKRIDVKGGSGWTGGVQTSLTQLAGIATPTWNAPAYAAMRDGSVSANSDAGHAEPAWGSFAVRPDGSLNTVLLRDFADRTAHEMAVATKALARAYYGRPARYAYFDGFSTGGMQGLSEAQRHADDFDGILAGAPAINWTRFLVGALPAGRRTAGPRRTATHTGAAGGSHVGDDTRLRRRRGRAPRLHPRPMALPLRPAPGPKRPLSFVGRQRRDAELPLGRSGARGRQDVARPDGRRQPARRDDRNR
jgi:hypothetical protein